MPFVDSREMLVRARAGRYAVGAFNVENMEMAQAVVMAAEKMRAPVMIQTTPGTLKYADAMLFAGQMLDQMQQEGQICFMDPKKKIFSGNPY